MVNIYYELSAGPVDHLFRSYSSHFPEYRVSLTNDEINVWRDPVSIHELTM